MKKITKIEPRRAEKKKLKVAAYARVSTGNEDQLMSLEAQKAHYEKLIEKEPDWIYAGLFFDEGISGAKKKGRDGLSALLQACKDRQVDFVLTKSISRLARNTIDSLEIVRELIELDIGIYFEKERINTKSMESEFMLSILSSLAESESKSISANQKWSIKKRFQNGTFVIVYPPYGYENCDGKMVIHEEQAKIVKEIFASYLSGKGVHDIAKLLNEKQIPSKRGGNWSGTTIRDMLKNEKYIGDVLFQKTYTDDQFKRHRNKGEKDRYLIKNNHQAIISREDYEKAQRLLGQKAREKGNGDNTSKYQNRYELSGKIKCSKCGGTFRRRHHYKPSGNFIAWACSEHIKDINKCSMKYVKDEDVKWCFTTMVNKLIFGHEKILLPLLQDLKKSKTEDAVERLAKLNEELEKISERKQTLVTLMTSGLLEPSIYSKEKAEIDQEYKLLEERKDHLENSFLGNKKHVEELEKLISYTKKANIHQDYPEEIFKEVVDEVLVIDRKSFEFKLKCGLSLREEMIE